ncbi:MAG: hypothetical protein JWL61_4188 [Gemmatimonadetes bacterium]|nr:hypothetical protein [Gemmatimonadota bacterium]
MALKEGLNSEVATIFRSAWTERDGTVVPADDSIKLGNDAVKLDATVLYADMADSTRMVKASSEQFAAELYKAFLHCAAKIIKAHDGTITAYDGDRIMGVYLGDSKNTRAVKTALKINWAVKNIIKPAQDRQYGEGKGHQLRHVVGVDTSALLVARTGVRGANDLVWVGRAANFAAKLAALPDAYPTYITRGVYSVMNEACRTTEGKSMWEAVSWSEFDRSTIYRSTWWWPLS